MRESMTLLEQTNTFQRISRQRFPYDRPIKTQPIRSSFSQMDEHDLELKSRSFDVYSRKHLGTTSRSVLPYSGRHQLDEILLPAIEKQINRSQDRRLRKKRRPVYSKSQYHSNGLSGVHQPDLSLLATNGAKAETQIANPTVDDSDTVINYQREYVPPPSPSDDEMDRFIRKYPALDSSRSPSQLSNKDKEGFIPFRLPALYRRAQHQRAQKKSSLEDVKSTLSNYLRKYY